MITYNDPGSADLIPAYTSDTLHPALILTATLGIVAVWAITIGIIYWPVNDTKKKNDISRNVMGAGVVLIGFSIVFFAMFKVNENTKAYDVENIEAQFNVDVEADFNNYTVTLPDGTRHTECAIEPARSWNTHDFEERPYQLMCNREQITVQRWNGQ